MIFRDFRNFIIDPKPIVEYINNNNLTKSQFSEMCKISDDTLEEILKNGIVYKTQDRFELMANILKINYYQLVKELKTYY